MSKVTGKDLERLIERVALTGLRDKVIPTKKPEYPQDDIEDLAQNAVPGDEVGQDDVQKAYTDNDEAEKSAALFLAKSLEDGDEKDDMVDYVTNAGAFSCFTTVYTLR